MHQRYSMQVTLARVLLQQYSVCNACSIRPARHVHAGGGLAYCGVRPPRALASLLCLHLLADAMDLVSVSHGSDRPGRVWSWLSSARKSMLLARGRAVPQDLRAATQHRPMEMRRAGIAFVTWEHVCASFARYAISYSRRVTLQADVLSKQEALVRLNKDKTSAVRSLMDDAGGTK